MKKGTKIRYRGDATTEQVKFGNNDDPREFLEPDRVYTVNKIEVHKWHTKIQLKEILDKRFFRAF